MQEAAEKFHGALAKLFLLHCCEVTYQICSVGIPTRSESELKPSVHSKGCVHKAQYFNSMTVPYTHTTLSIVYKNCTVF